LKTGNKTLYLRHQLSSFSHY